MASPKVTLAEAEKETLLRWAHLITPQRRLSLRAKVVLAAADGKRIAEIAREVNASAVTVGKWIRRFAREGLEGLKDASRPGVRPRYDKNADERILSLVGQPPPEGHVSWNGTLVARELGDVSAHYVWRVLRKNGIHLERRREWTISTDPQFEPKATDLVGLYLAPPFYALVLSADDNLRKSPMPCKGSLRLPDSKVLGAGDDDMGSKEPLFLTAALDLAATFIRLGRFNPPKKHDCADFVNRLIASNPGKEMHVLVDGFPFANGDAEWLAPQPNVHVHHAPSHGVWLGQVELFIALLARPLLARKGAISARQVREAIERFTLAHDHSAAPFEWVKRPITSGMEAGRSADDGVREQRARLGNPSCKAVREQTAGSSV